MAFLIRVVIVSAMGGPITLATPATAVRAANSAILFSKPQSKSKTPHVPYIQTSLCTDGLVVRSYSNCSRGSVVVSSEEHNIEGRTSEKRFQKRFQKHQSLH